MRNNCLEKRMRLWFYDYGNAVAANPWLFILFPIFITAGLGAGFRFLKEEKNVIYLYTPRESTALDDRTRLLVHFEHVRGFDPRRSLDIPTPASVIITHRNRSSILDSDSRREIFELDDFIRNINGNGSVFDSICEKTMQGTCVGSNVLPLMASHENLGELKYPMHCRSPLGISPCTFLGYELGGVTTTEEGYIADVAAVHLTYYAADSGAGRAWLEEFGQQLAGKRFEHIHVDRWHTYSVEEELEKSSHGIFPYYGIAIVILITFSIIATVLRDPVRSKPSLALCGVISAGLAIVSAMGLLMYCQLPLTDLVVAAPFLALGIGMDDMFVMLAAWRRTDHYMSMKERLAAAMSEAVVSITITSVTDVLAIAIGTITPFPAVRIFCIYTSVMLLLEYIFQITFFAGCMALSGKREEENRHGWTCQKVMPKSQAGDVTDCYDSCCAGGVSKEDPNVEVDNTEICLNRWFRDSFSVIITHSAGKAIIMLLTLAYLCLATWGCITITPGIALEDLAPTDTYVHEFYKMEARYFSDYDYQVQIVVGAQLDSKEKINKTKDMLTELEDSEFFWGPELTISWLRDYERYTLLNNMTINYNDLFDTQFFEFLENEEFVEYATDALWQVDTFRFILVANATKDPKDEQRQMHTVRILASKYKELGVIVYSPHYIITEQYALIFGNMLKVLQFSFCVMLFVSLLLIPSPIVALWVTMSMVSICFGVVGFMALWNISLDPISINNIIICIGFSVDFSAHITYAFVSSDEVRRNARTVDALHSLGLPILQGFLSTILGVVVLSISTAYIYITFVKVIFLAIAFSMMHGLFVLPALLGLVGPKGRVEGESTFSSVADVIF